LISELVYTSVPKGLAVGSSGFCTVAYTEGMPQPLILTCESLSTYRHLFPPGDRREALNPVLFSHTLVTRMDKPFSVLSRVAAYGADYSGRTNKLAHHMVFSPDQRVVQGPAAILQTPGLMRTEWKQEPAILPSSPRLQAEEEPTTYRAVAWEKLTGWAGWAGVLAGAFLEQPRRPVYMIFNAGMELLPLIAEAIALLPPLQRWQVTFNTYCTALPQSSECLWRCCLPTAEFLPKVRNQADAFILDLSSPMERPSSEGEDIWVHCAITGDRPDWDSPTPPGEHRVASATESKKTAPSSMPKSRPRVVGSANSTDAAPAQKSFKWGWGIWGLVGVVALACWWQAEQTKPPVPEPPRHVAQPVPSNTVVQVSPATTNLLVEPEPLPPTNPPVITAPPVVSAPELSLRKTVELTIPKPVRENQNTFVLADLPPNLAEAERMSFYLTPGFRVVRTNGTLFADGVSGSLAGRGSGEMSLMVNHPKRGLDEISLRLKDSELRCSARAEWLSCLVAVQFDFPQNESRLIICSPPWHVSSSLLKYSAEEHQLRSSLDATYAPALVKSILSSGTPSDWSARLRFDGGPEVELQVFPEEETFRFVFSEKDRSWLDLMRQIQDRKSIREKPLPDLDSDGADDWGMLKELLADWLAVGRDAQLLMAPLKAMVPAETVMILNEPGSNPADSLIDNYRNALASASASDIRAAMLEIRAKAHPELDAVTSFLSMLQNGKGLKLYLKYRNSLLIVMEDN
jgi:hypothetical protein